MAPFSLWHCTIHNNSVTREIMNTKSPTKSHQQMVAEWKEDPEFVAAYDELEAETAELRKGLQSQQRSSLTQFFRQSLLHDVEINLDRSADCSRSSEQ